MKGKFDPIHAQYFVLWLRRVLIQVCVCVQHHRDLKVAESPSKIWDSDQKHTRVQCQGWVAFSGHMVSTMAIGGSAA